MLTIMPVRFVSSDIPVGVESPYSKVLLLLTGKKLLKKVIKDKNKTAKYSYYFHENIYERC